MDESRLAEKIAAAAREAGTTVAVAESLTAGRLSAALGAAPGAGDWYRGGVVAYSTLVKRRVLGMPDCSPVCEKAASALARGARELLVADVAVAVTGVGGPDRQDGEPVGSVWFAVATAAGARSVHRDFDGDAPQIVDATVDYALRLLLDAVGGD
ncbi:CinA family protein [Nocardia blacklockiae]|uniref:CinA family protein n=1 Tax=Nocardia blacklockiae TaxID=480036 RepID=UPI00189405B0|nr:CinA family protein [Nocardia blacklockiae]MBF6175086.1 CinA family protein [Nocardia blacklockiae]